jgi:type I restriction enzyme S subunit
MTVGEPFLNAVDMAINQDMKAVLPDTEMTNPHFLVYSLWDKDPYLKSLGRGTTVDGITTSDLSRTHIGLPSLEEQRKIASVLHTVDQAIQKTEEIIEQTERVHQGLIQNLLKDGINEGPKTETDSRFGQLPESWELRPLKEIGEIAGRTAPEKDETDCWGGDIPWVTPSEITSLEGPIISDTKEHLTELALEKVSSNLLPSGSVLLTTRATVGECAVNTVEMTTNQGFKNFVPGDKIDTWYAYYRLEYEGDYLSSLSKGSTFPEVGKETVENFVIPVPPLDEQKEIGKRLRSLDDLILSYKSNKDQLQRLKQGLMQDLLSGEVRTHDKDIEVVDDVIQYG